MPTLSVVCVIGSVKEKVLCVLLPYRFYGATLNPPLDVALVSGPISVSFSISWLRQVDVQRLQRVRGIQGCQPHRGAPERPQLHGLLWGQPLPVGEHKHRSA